MFSFVIGLGLAWLLGAIGGARIGRTGPRTEQRKRALRDLRASRAQVVGGAPFFGAVFTGEMVLECPPLLAYWCPVGLTALYAFGVLMPVLWTEAVRPGWERSVGRRGLPSFEEVIRGRGLALLWRYGWLGVAFTLVSGHTSLPTLCLIYVGFLMLTGAMSPALLRLYLPSRRTTRAEARRIRAVAATYGFDVGTVRVRTGSRADVLNASVAGLWPAASRVAVTERLLLTLSDEELGFVLAHEVAHRDDWHAAKRLAVAVLVSAGTAGLAVELLGSSEHDLVTVLGVLVLLPWLRRLLVSAYSRRGEAEADAVAARRVGVAAAQRALVRLHTNDGIPQRKNRLAELRSTHPGARQRLIHVTQVGAPGTPLAPLTA